MGRSATPAIRLTRRDFLDDRVGRTFADIAEHPAFADLLEFFNDSDRQRRMEESELHHDRPPLAGVVRELEAVPSVNRFLGNLDAARSKRFRQATGVVVRIIMEARGWRTTGRKGSLGVRAGSSRDAPRHNVGGLAFWFIRAERYQRPDGMPFESVRTRSKQLDAGASAQPKRRPRTQRAASSRNTPTQAVTSRSKRD